MSNDDDDWECEYCLMGFIGYDQCLQHEVNCTTRKSVSKNVRFAVQPTKWGYTWASTNKKYKNAQKSWILNPENLEKMRIRVLHRSQTGLKLWCEGVVGSYSNKKLEIKYNDGTTVLYTVGSKDRDFGRLFEDQQPGNKPASGLIFEVKETLVDEDDPTMIYDRKIPNRRY
jgi:hypothetical protein